MTARSRPSLDELRAVAQPGAVIGRVSGEHWAGKLYMRHVSIHLTRALIPVRRVTPDGLTWSMLLLGPLAGLVLTVPHWWSAVVAFALVQLQELLDCADGELARWRGQTGPRGIYIDRLGHYVTDASLAIAVGVHADGGLASIAGWTTLGLATGVLVLITKAETDLVHSARAAAGLAVAPDDAVTAAPRRSLLRRARSAVLRLPVNRALLAIEMTILATVAAVADAIAGTPVGMQVLAVALLCIAVFVAVGHLLSVVTSGRLR
jgi:phosphatidylglycerophosphate synthase